MRDPLPYIADVLRILAGAAPLRAQDPPVITLRDDWRCAGRCAFTYADGSTLAVRLYVDCAGNRPRWLKYSFVHRDATGVLRIRWDDAAHEPGRGRFPHVHLADGRVVPGGPPRLRDVAALIRDAVARTLADQP